MKSVFDACCSIPPGSEPVRGTTTYGASSQPKPAVQTTTTATFTQGEPVQQTQGTGQNSSQPISNMLSAVEGTAGSVKTFFANAVQDPSRPGGVSSVSASSDLLHSNVVAGEGEEKQSFGQAISAQGMPIVGIFPANSKTGLAVLRSLTGYPNRNSCAKIHCIVRDETHIPDVKAELNEHLTDSISWEFADFDSDKGMTTAFIGLDRLVIIPPNTEDRADQVCRSIMAAKLAGVNHVILMSAMMAMHPQTVFGKQFRLMEQCLENVRPSVNITTMRMAWFMDNFLDMAPDLVSNNRFLSSWGPSGVSAVALGDIGRSAAAVLASPKGTDTFYNRTYHLTGPEALSGFRMAEIFSKVLGRPIAYQDLPRDEMRKVYLDGMKLPEWQADGFLDMNDLFKSGAAAAFSTDVAMLTKGNHTTLERFVRNKRWYFSGQRAPLICIFPASGHIGSNTLGALMEDRSQTRIRAVVRSEECRADLQTKYASQSRLEIVDGDFAEPESVTSVLDGVDSLLIIPPEKLETFSLIDSAIKAANNAGVSHTILLSVSQALYDTAIGRKFTAWERVLEHNSYSYTILRSNLFHDMMFNFADQIKRPDHTVHHWLGNGRFCPMDARDVGEACAAVLREGPIEHHGHIYNLYGPQAVSFPEILQILSKVLGYQVSAVGDVTSEQLRLSMQDKLPSFNVEEVVQAHEAIAKGNDVNMTPDLLKLTGRAITIQAFFENYKDKFEGTIYPAKSSHTPTAHMGEKQIVTTTTTTVLQQVVES